jgi:hypothetical protein
MMLETALGRLMDRLGKVEMHAQSLSEEVGVLEDRFPRRLEATRIDGMLLRLSRERDGLLREEQSLRARAEAVGGWGIMSYGVLSIVSGQRPTREGARAARGPQEPFGDVRVVLRGPEDIGVVSVSGIAREKGISIPQAIASLERDGSKVLTWWEFEGWARRIREDVLVGRISIDAG